MRRAKMVFAVIIIFCLLVGCCKKEEIPESEKPITILAILLGNHANSKKLNPQLFDKIEQVYSSFGNICIICIDGKPEVVRDDENNGMMVGSYDVEYLKKSRNDYQYREIWERDYLNEQILELNNYLEESHVDDSEVDTLEAFHSAVAALNDMELIVGGSDGNKKIEKEIVICDTGLCTTGKLNFLNYDYLKLIKNEKNLNNDDVGQEEVNKLIEDLEANMEIPDLSGITVTWYGLGEVDKPQPNLSKLDKENLQYIWSEILRRSEAIPSKAKNTKLDYFVQLKGYEIEISEEYVTPVIWWEGVGNIESKEEIIIKEEEIGFIANYAKYSSVEKANKVLRPYAENLLNYDDLKVLLLGTTSSYGGGSVELSMQRAEKVKESLVELGVPEERIVTAGLGYNEEFCENDSPNGEFIEEIGKNNRAVYILPLESEKAEKALNELY